MSDVDVLGFHLKFSATEVYVLVQFYPCFKFYFPLFSTHYHTLPYPKTEKKLL